MIVDHLPFPIYRKIGKLSEISLQTDLLEQRINFLITWAGEIKILLRALLMMEMVGDVRIVGGLRGGDGGSVFGVAARLRSRGHDGRRPHGRAGRVVW